MVVSPPARSRARLSQVPNALASALDAFYKPDGVRFWVAAALIVVLLAVTTTLVFVFGGTKLSYVHALYVPILAGALFFGFRGGAITGVVAGLCVGPFMPLDVAEDIAQNNLGWIVRTCFFAGIGGLAGMICSMLVWQLKSAREHGYYNALTRLPNRALLQEHLTAKIAACSKTRRTFALIKIRLERYSVVSSTLGYSHADALLIEAARRLTDALPRGAMLYDLDGGEFATVVEPFDDAMDLSRTLIEVLNQRVVINTIPILPGGHVGIAGFPDHGESSVRLLQAASSALEQATTTRLPHAIYNERKDREQRATSRLLPDLHGALTTPDQITLVFQPKVDLHSEDCVGVEALVRWKHPELGMVPPDTFIPLAEETVLIKQLTERVIGAALSQASLWKKDGIDLPIAINLSARNLEDPGLPAVVGDLLKRHGMPPSQLEFEITETALNAIPQTMASTLCELRGLGSSIALDDFGAGHCSLAYLRDLPADVLKLDRSFIRNLTSDRRTQLIVAALIDAAHGLGHKVVAEGIEDLAVFDLLREMGCNYGQGYFIARPLSEQDLRSWLSYRSAPLCRA